MKTKIVFAGVAVGVVLQFAIPAGMIYRQEEVLRKGARVCFETTAVDPLDVFRGRYVELELAEFGWRGRRHALPGGALHALIETNAQGVASVAGVVSAPPGGDALYFKVARRYARSDYLANPFNRFYMPEKLAPVAEEIYRETLPRWGGEGTTNSVLLAVRVYKGRAAVEDLLVNGVPMTKAAQERLKAKKNGAGKF
ncbi:MAG: GDYXXLXY domain-containing protein [Kiritimatiellaeota bacterium]|nr:GDYXXLXY domain-containing protein [Kiritimatiellota bacterium]